MSMVTAVYACLVNSNVDLIVVERATCNVQYVADRPVQLAARPTQRQIGSEPAHPVGT